ncbi:alkaline phosphatase family protein [Halomicronema sp. CCY15110]|uniref:alkaline phosphatase family protein n=1 Tax=Halomicronema sp. CCY15110 TaxID=2767773 RepID=UPI0019500636|nr:alkaline phosphatase family protein [Halomicronema sp. CCY15110]
MKPSLPPDRPQFILLFLDGVGLGDRATDNPLAIPEHTPFLSQLLGSPLVRELSVRQPQVLAKPIDARLGIPGLPQSATGQTTLYTGMNAAKFRGHHQSGFANGSLRQLIEAHSLFRQVMQLGGTATLANLYSPAYFEAIAQRRIRYAVGTLVNLTAQLPFRMQSEYEQEQAIFWDITGELAAARGIITAPPISPAVAGQRLAALGGRHTFTLFECFLPDYAGHRQDWGAAIAVLQRVDQCVEKLVENLPTNVTLVITSDHGNVENLTTKRHTLNAVPLIAIGPNAQDFHPIHDLTGVATAIMQSLQSPALSSNNF